MLPLEHIASLRSSIGLLAGTVVVIVIVFVTLLLFIAVNPTAQPHGSLTTLALFHLALLRAVIVTVSRCRANLEFVQLVPFSISTVPLRNRK